MFLTLLMSALIAKIIAMSTVGANIIPLIWIITVTCAVLILRVSARKEGVLEAKPEGPCGASASRDRTSEELG